eukprot:85314_1
MTILVNLGVAFSVFIVSVVILSTNYKTIWPAPNFVTHSATYDYIFQDIASNSFINNPIEIEYTYKSQPIPTLSSNFIENNSFDSPHHKELILHQSILEKQSNLHHLLHIPPWALVPDRISHASGTVSDLFKIFDSLRLKQELTLSILSDIIEIIPTESIIKSHMEHLSSSEKFWISNITSELFNASQIIFSYQLINYADEISEWIQNSEYSNKYLRLLFERIRGLPLLYNPFIKEQYNNINLEYNNLCIEIINLIDESDDNDIMTIEQCIIFLDNIIPKYLSRIQNELNDITINEKDNDLKKRKIYAKECIIRLIKSNENNKSKEICWNWKSKCGKLRIDTAMKNRGLKYNGYDNSSTYFGSYCVDGLAMALHSLYYTNSIGTAIQMAVNMLGDADSTGSVVGQMAGAFYGFNHTLANNKSNEKFLLDLCNKWDDFDFGFRGVLLPILGYRYQNSDQME